MTRDVVTVKAGVTQAFLPTITYSRANHLLTFREILLIFTAVWILRTAGSGISRRLFSACPILFCTQRRPYNSFFHFQPMLILSCSATSCCCLGDPNHVQWFSRWLHFYLGGSSLSESGWELNRFNSIINFGGWLWTDKIMMLKYRGLFKPCLLYYILPREPENENSTLL